MIASRGREVEQVAPSGPNNDALTKKRFYAQRSRVEKTDEKEIVMMLVSSLSFLRYEFLLSGGLWFVYWIEVLESVSCA